MSIMTTEDDEMGSGLLSTQERAIIRTTWNKAKKDGDVAPKLLFKYDSNRNKNQLNPY